MARISLRIASMPSFHSRASARIFSFCTVIQRLGLISYSVIPTHLCLFSVWFSGVPPALDVQLRYIANRPLVREETLFYLLLESLKRRNFTIFGVTANIDEYEALASRAVSCTYRLEVERLQLVFRG